VPYFNTRERRMITVTGFSLGGLLIVITIISGIYAPTPPYWIPITQRANNSILLAIILALSIPAAVEYMNANWLKGVEKNIPILLRDVAENVQSGVPLLTALEEAAHRDYGPISKPLEAAMIRFDLTSDIEGSLNWFGKELKRPIARRLSTVLIEAYQSGGRINDVLTTSVDMFSSISDYREERRSQTGPYTMIVYIGTLIFYAISWVLLVQFLGPLAVKMTDPTIAQSGLLKNMLDINFYKSVLLWACVMESVLGGFVVGKTSEGRIAAGLIHSMILLIITLVFFNSFTV
jgi:flagellar protein FlaJ